jgi:aryl-alcohol dehydrogenase-like predicted oxidoreductase
MTRSNWNPDRREVIQIGLAAGAGLLLGNRNLSALAPASGTAALITKPIPSTGERIPVIGLGTNNYSVEAEADLAPRREVLRKMPDLGLTVVDTAPSYGRSEQVIGDLVAEIGNRNRLFIATKVTAPQNDVARGTAMLEESFRRLKVDKVELMQVHNLNGTSVMLPVLREWQQAGRIKYIGVTTSSDNQYEEMIAIMQKEKLDFIQVDYSIGNRNAAERILPLAADRGMAVLLNVPFGGRRGNAVGVMGGKELPSWAAEIGCTSWAQLFLKYNVSHPAVTCAIPGTTRLEHLEDNARAAQGELPDAGMRRRIEEVFDNA